MNLKYTNFGNSKQVKFNLSDSISKKHWHNIAESIVEEVFSPRAVMDNSTDVKITIRDNKAKINIQHNGNGFVEINYVVNEFGCVEEDYIGSISEQIQFIMYQVYGKEYLYKVKEKQESATVGM